MTKITCISDTHGHFPELPGGDLLIIAGDLTARDQDDEHRDFIVWLCQICQNNQYKRIVYIAGNHDGFLDPSQRRYGKVNIPLGFNIEYLCDSGTMYYDLKIWGSPWTPVFYDWHFMKERGQDIRKMWDMIPLDTDILITHGPPYGILDEVDGVNVGCEELRTAVERVKSRLHVFGHVHEAYGTMRLKHEKSDTICVNASIMNDRYNPVNKPITVEI